MFPSCLAGARDELAAYVGALVPSSVALEDVDGLVEGLAEIERLAAGGRLLLAGRTAEVPRVGTADRDGAGFLARVTGSSVGAARAAIETSSRLPDLPTVEAAVRAGQLNEQRANVVADAAAAAPGEEQRLVRMGRNESMRHLREQARTIKAAADPRSAEEKHAEVQRTRRASSWTTPEGGGELGGVGPIEQMAEITAALDAHRDRILRAGVPEGTTYANVTFDALLAMARASVRGGDADKPIAKKILVRIDRAVRLTGEAARGQVCDLPGWGPIPVSVAEELMKDQTWHAILTVGIAVAAVTHGQRKANSVQRTALDWTEPGCCVEGCPNRGHHQIDHIEDWAATKTTAHGVLQRLCTYHHDLKTRYGYQYEDQPDGRKRAVSPAEQRRRAGARRAAEHPTGPQPQDPNVDPFPDVMPRPPTGTTRAATASPPSTGPPRQASPA